MNFATQHVYDIITAYDLGVYKRILNGPNPISLLYPSTISTMGPIYLYKLSQIKIWISNYTGGPLCSVIIRPLTTSNAIQLYHRWSYSMNVQLRSLVLYGSDYFWSTFNTDSANLI